MDKKNNNVLIFVLLGAVLLGFIFFNSNTNTYRSAGKAAVNQPGICYDPPGWYCLDWNTKYYLNVKCKKTQITDCGTNEICQNGGCVPQMDQTHTECIQNAWVSVQGPGINQCVTTTDCLNSCSDTDGGIAPFVQGTDSGIINGYPYSQTDHCGGSIYLIESYCLGNTNSTQIINCQTQYSMSCQNGRCI